MLMELLIALHIDITKAAKGMGLETHTSNGLAPAKWQKNYSHSQEDHWKGLWPSAVCRGAFYYTIAVKPVCRTHSGTQELLSYTGVCAILS